MKYIFPQGNRDFLSYVSHRDAYTPQRIGNYADITYLTTAIANFARYSGHSYALDFLKK